MKNVGITKKLDASIFNGTSLHIVVNGQRYSIQDSDPKWNKAVEAYKNKEYDKLLGLMDLPGTIVRYSEGKIKVTDGGVYFNDAPIHGTIANRIVSFAQDGYPFQPLVRFLNNLMKNPDAEALMELYDFLEKSQLPITDDGCFLAYKGVDKDFRTSHPNPDGTRNLHRLGKPVTMKRSECDSNRSTVCSTGLHFCSYDYLPSYMGGEGQIFIVKINPKDVTSFPKSFESKGRTCAYLPTVYLGKWTNSGNILTERLYSGKVGNLKPFKRDKHGRFSDGKSVSRKPKRDAFGHFV